MQKQKIYTLINEVLIKWNPLSVEGIVLNDEYLSIVPSIAKLDANKNQISTLLVQIMNGKFGVSYDDDEIAQVAEEICQILLHK